MASEKIIGSEVERNISPHGYIVTLEFEETWGSLWWKKSRKFYRRYVRQDWIADNTWRSLPSYRPVKDTMAQGLEHIIGQHNARVAWEEGE